MERGVRVIFPEAETFILPMADGGEGTVDALVQATGGSMHASMVSDPLGRPVQAAWGVLGDGKTAVAEMAAASGLCLLKPEERSPFAASTRGTGEMLLDIIRQGYKNIILGIGGSATNDGGTGFIRAFGAKFLDAAGRELPEGGKALANLAFIDLSGLDECLKDATLQVACDVDNPLCGSRGASAVYGPQKGATPDMVRELDIALARYGETAERATGRNIMGTPGVGAAGGLGAGLLFFTNAKLRPGIDIVLEATDFYNRAKGMDLILTGEGQTDFQTAFGKAPSGVARVGNENCVPVVCLSGSLGKDYLSLLDKGFSAVASCMPEPLDLNTAMSDALRLVEEASIRAVSLIRTGMGMRK